MSNEHNTPAATSGDTPALPKDMRAALCSAVVDCGHMIEMEAVKLYRDPRIEGNALSQLLDRIESAVSAATKPTAVGFAERDQSKPAEQQGLFRKFDVRRVDGSDQPGGKHYGCRYYVLDLTHDQHAPTAMRAYAAACRATHPNLANDIEAEFGAATKPTADLPIFCYAKQVHKSWPEFNKTDEFSDGEGGGEALVKLADVQSLLATKPAVAPIEAREQALEDAAKHCTDLFDSQGAVALLFAAQEIRALKRAAQPTLKGAGE